jgi:hypothetical protein
MKKVILAIGISATLIGCKYPSYNEAMSACKKWSDEGGSYTENFVNAYDKRINLKSNIRHCIPDDSDQTRVILGRVYPKIKDGEILYDQGGEKRNYTEIQKRFYY